MKLIFTINFFCTVLCLGELKLEQVPRLNTSTALKILNACHDESLQQNVDVGIVVVGIDGRILASLKSEKMDANFCNFRVFPTAKGSIRLNKSQSRSIFMKS